MEFKAFKISVYILLIYKYVSTGFLQNILHHWKYKCKIIDGQPN